MNSPPTYLSFYMLPSVIDQNIINCSANLTISHIHLFKYHYINALKMKDIYNHIFNTNCIKINVLDTYNFSVNNNFIIKSLIID